MKRFIILFAIIVYTSYIYSCKNENLGADLAKAYCGACHLTPDPKLLDKKTWKEDILPYMAVWVGRRPIQDLNSIPYQDISRIEASGILPHRALMSDDKWAAIVKYYVDNAPEKLEIPTDTNSYQSLTDKFSISPLNIESSGIAMLHFDTLSKKLAISNLDNDFFLVDTKQNTVVEKIKVSNPAVHLTNETDGSVGLTLVGMMNPNDGQTGIFGWATIQNHRFESKKLIKKLSRPVFSVLTDINADTQKDVVVASFGNFIGNLSWYEWKPDGSTEQHVIKNSSGALQIVAKDMNKDNKTDLVVLWGQGDEGVSIFYNNGIGKFKEEKVLRFPPVYGSISMQLIDFDHDGDDDIVYTNGDNGDESRILKPYHGVRVFLNNGKNTFQEKYFFPIHGTIKTLAHDFDKDKDLDLIAISFFPDYTKTPNKSIVYLENKGNWKFSAAVSPITDKGRWMVMDLADYDQDGNTDIVVGSCKENPAQKETMKDNKRVWVLKNKLNTK